jgi:hypothetical protein
MITRQHAIVLTPEELEALYWLLGETAQSMDDDGREGAFDASPLREIYVQVLKLRGDR